MPVFIGNRDDLVRTRAGHAIGFKAGEEKHVPDIPEVIQACINRGHAQKKDKPAPKPAVKKAPASPLEEMKEVRKTRASKPDA